MLHSCGHEASDWPQLYQPDPDFSTTYQLLGTGANVTDFQNHDGTLCHLGHLCVPTSDRVPTSNHENLIWEAHYNRMVGHFGVEKIVVVLKKHFYFPKLQQDVIKYIKILHFLCHFQAIDQEARLIENTWSRYQPRMLSIRWPILYFSLGWSILINGMLMLITYHMKRDLQMKKKIYSGCKVVLGSSNLIFRKGKVTS
jgi:hypothetical protein